VFPAKCELNLCYVEESRPPLWSSGQSSWLYIQRSGFHSRRYQIFWEEVGTERGPFSLVSTIEELLERHSSGSGLVNREYGRGDPLCWLRDTLSPQKLALTSPGVGGCSAGILRSRTQALEYVCFLRRRTVFFWCDLLLTSLLTKNCNIQYFAFPPNVLNPIFYLLKLMIFGKSGNFGISPNAIFFSLLRIHTKQRPQFYNLCCNLYTFWKEIWGNVRNLIATKNLRIYTYFDEGMKEIKKIFWGLKVSCSLLFHKNCFHTKRSKI
jgi:hypothetical protein